MLPLLNAEAVAKMFTASTQPFYWGALAIPSWRYHTLLGSITSHRGANSRPIHPEKRLSPEELFFFEKAQHCLYVSYS